jgi:endonuclease III
VGGLKRENLKILVKNFGKRYSEVLGISLEKGGEGEVFKWFLASILFGAPITERSAIKTYKCFEKYDVLTPAKVLERGWDGLVSILDEGSYTRYDFKTADKLIEVMKNLVEKYGGRLENIHEAAINHEDLERILKGLGKGIGETTVSIFLREMRGIWRKAMPKPTPLVMLAAQNLGLVVKGVAVHAAVKQLEEFWSENKIEGETYVNFETALLRLGKDFCRKERCSACPLMSECLNPKSSV